METTEVQYDGEYAEGAAASAVRRMELLYEIRTDNAGNVWITFDSDAAVKIVDASEGEVSGLKLGLKIAKCLQDIED